jgi:ketosteroid isomerase-like protein
MKILVSCVLLTCCGTAFSQADPQIEIRSIRQKSNRAIVQRNVNEFAESLSNDFVMVRGSGVFVSSKQEYLDLFKRDFADPKSIRYERTPEKIEISSAAPLAAEHGRWVGLNVDGTVAYRGSYLAMWRHEQRGWKIRSELFVLLSCGAGEACRSYAAKTNAAQH